MDETIEERKEPATAQFRCPEELWIRVKVLAARKRTSSQQICIDALELYVTQQEAA